MLSSVMSQKFIEQLGSSRQGFTGCGKRASVMLSPFAALRINCAKHLHFLIENKQLQILRCAQDDIVIRMTA